MKIGILTFHRSINNGAVMQCYSLSKLLKESLSEHEIEVIDYQMEKVDKSYQPTLSTYLSGGSIPGKVKRLIKFIINPRMFDDARIKYQVFNNAITHLPLSEFHIIDDSSIEIEKYITDNIDILVVGSDAIWNYSTRGFPNAYFPSRGLRCKKVSYAASCYGMDFLKCKDSDRKEIRNRLEDFSFIGVRDTATENFVRWSGCPIQPVHTCDPTLCLDVDSLPINIDELNKKLIERGFDYKRRSIGVMGNDEMANMVKRMFGNSYQIVSLFNRNPSADVQLFDLSPFEWAYVFRYFSLTFTTYFHGTMLSLRNGVPVICVALETDFSKKHTPKVLDALDRLGFKDWYFHTDYKTSNVEAIRHKAEELLSVEWRETIIESVNKESKTFDSFIDCLKSICNGGETK